MAKRILVASNAFKGTIEAKEAVRIIGRTLSEFKQDLEIDLAPIADGGDGTCDLLSDQLGLTQIETWALDPIGRPITGKISYDDSLKKAYLDVSSVSGLGLLKSPHQLPFVTSTFGTGLLINKAIALGAKEIVLGLGGSATIDLGVGIMQALGLRMLSEKGREIVPFSPETLGKVRHIQLNKPLPNVKFTFLCDVKNPFFGNDGAIPVYGPQKGLDIQEFDRMNLAINSFLKVLAQKFNKPIQDQPCFGAAGGIAFGLSFLFPFEIASGASYFFKQTRIKEKLEKSDLIFTGEGKYDAQSSEGKGAYELLQMAKERSKKVILITSGKEGYNQGFEKVIELPPLDFLKDSYEETAKENLRKGLNEFLKGYSL